MPARKKLSLVELMILMAIAGILLSILLPNMERAKRRSEATRRPPAVEVAPGEGQFNQIETPELSTPRESMHPSQWIGVIVGFIPIIVAAVVIYTVFNRVRRRISRRA